MKYELLLQPVIKSPQTKDPCIRKVVQYGTIEIYSFITYLCFRMSFLNSSTLLTITTSPVRNQIASNKYIATIRV